MRSLGSACADTERANTPNAAAFRDLRDRNLRERIPVLRYETGETGGVGTAVGTDAIASSRTVSTVVSPLTTMR